MKKEFKFKEKLFVLDDWDGFIKRDEVWDLSKEFIKKLKAERFCRTCQEKNCKCGVKDYCVKWKDIKEKIGEIK